MAEEQGRSRLGRGLAALIGDVGDEIVAIERARGQRRVPVEFLRPSTRNPRRNFVEEDLEDLTTSIRERGILQPIIVRSIPGMMDAYEIIAGERRWRAAQRAELHDVPAVSYTHLVSPAGKGGDLAFRCRKIGGLVKGDIVANQRLVGGEHEAVGTIARDRKRLGAGKRRGHLIRRDTAIDQRFFDRTFVDLRFHYLDRDAGSQEHVSPGRAAGGEDQRRVGEPEIGRGDHVAMNFMRWSRSRSRIEAAVSSIERRVTSITGQPLRAQRRRDCVTSSATASGST